MYYIYGYLYHQYTPNVSIYTSTMDPMGYNGFQYPMVYVTRASKDHYRGLVSTICSTQNKDIVF